MNDNNHPEHFIQKIASDHYGSRCYTITDLFINKIQIQRSTIIDELLKYYSNHFKEISNSEYKHICKAIKSKEKYKEGLRKKIAIIEKIESTPPADFTDYDKRLTALISLANYEIITPQGSLSTLAYENGTEISNYLIDHTQDIILEKKPLSDDSQDIINLGISLSLIYGYILSLKLIEPREIALVSKLDLISNKFFYAFGKHVDNGTEISELDHLAELDKIEANRLRQITISKYAEWNITLIPFIECIFEEGKLKNKKRIDSIADEILFHAKSQGIKNFPVKKTIISSLKEIFLLQSKEDVPSNWIHNKIIFPQQ